MPSKGFAPSAWGRGKTSRESNAHRRLSKFRAARRRRAWHPGKRGWFVAEAQQVVTHPCKVCGKIRFAYSYECFKFWRLQAGVPQIQTRYRRGWAGRPELNLVKCRCFGKRGPSPRDFTLWQKSTYVEKAPIN